MSQNIHLTMCHSVPKLAPPNSAKWVQIMKRRFTQINKTRNAVMAKYTSPVSGELCAVTQLVQATRYKPEARGFDSRWCHCRILPTALRSLGRLSLSNINKYQEYFLGGKGGRWVGLTTFMCRLSRNLGASTSGTLRACPGIALAFSPCAWATPVPNLITNS